MKILLTLLSKTLLILVLLMLILPSGNVNAIAYCSLRDPVAQISQLYPQKTNQLSIVKTVNDNTRAQVQIALPSNDLHFSELGQHTLYIAMLGKESLGYIHVRSEQSDWGLVEIVWAIDKDLKITNFAFQRCRSPKKKIAQEIGFKNIFIGKNYQELKGLLSNDGVTAKKEVLEKVQQAPELANVVLRCALKTLLLTEMLWGDELEEL
ncbi:hypothetical protein [Colwellia psychrerythraea]|uniref:Uncharacterized protein n=1 Tax=Colwellia psychrerythraea TaxID=28229 RepID=A0A099L012_COLPS|nr:hypothetical protein [Colwellia psychrerythraea]KGJ96176.1 hypothetical protein GAB14E_0123 [Colwellia psychrerythraea]